jgi:hypothetical protein
MWIYNETQRADWRAGPPPPPEGMNPEEEYILQDYLFF